MAPLAAILSLALALPGSDPEASAPVDWSGVEDGRARFREIYCAIRRRSAGETCESEIIRLAGEAPSAGWPVELGRARLPMRVLVVPGLYGDCFPVAAFSDALPRLTALGHEVGSIAVGGFSRISTNAARIRDAVAALDLRAGEPLVLVAHSKGVPDVMEALVAHPEVRDRVKALVSVAGVVSGTPLAERVDSDRFLGPLARLSAHLCPERDPETIAELGRPARHDWWSRNRLPDSVRAYSVVGLPGRDRLPAALRASYDILAKHDPRNDGAVIASDAVVPGSKLLAFVRADHWAIALPLSRDMPRTSRLGLTRYEFPRDALLEAIIRAVEEDLLAGR